MTSSSLLEKIIFSCVHVKLSKITIKNYIGIVKKLIYSCISFITSYIKIFSALINSIIINSHFKFTSRARLIWTINWSSYFLQQIITKQTFIRLMVALSDNYFFTKCKRSDFILQVLPNKDINMSTCQTTQRLQPKSVHNKILFKKKTSKKRV